MSVHPKLDKEKDCGEKDRRSDMIIESRSAEETFALGKKIGEQARPGDVYTLVGDLGVGKTVFTQGLAEGLEITEPISSPTFTIVQVYEEGRLPFYHFDVYRIGDVEEMEEIGYHIVTTRGDSLVTIQDHNQELNLKDFTGGNENV